MVIDSISKKVQQGRESLEQAASTVSGERAAAHDALKQELGDFALSKVIDRIDQFDEALPVFERIGFELVRLDVEIGISPSVSARFDINRIPTEEEQKQALASLQGDGSLHTLLNSMLKACKLHQHLQVGRLEFNALVVTLATLPSVQMVFGEPRPEDEL